MFNLRFHNLRKILDYIREIRNKPIAYPSVFSTLKKMFLFLILYLFVTGVTAVIVIFSFNKKQETVLVPKVISMEFYRAYKLLYERDFVVEVELKPFNNFSSGVVAFQSITEGKKVKKGRKITLIVSSGISGEDYSGGEDTPVLNSFIIRFKLPEKYDEGRVRILISDKKVTDRVVFDELASPTNKIMIPVKIYGNGIQKIYINDELYIEKDIE